MHGEILGPYRVEREIGRGAMGTVYLAHVVSDHAGLDVGAPVALKVLHAGVIAQPRAAERLRREASLGGSVRHANVVSFYGSDVIEAPDGPRGYVAMEYVVGRTLRAMLDELGRVPEALLREIARRVADGLAAIHAAGAVHRDVKPENILITPDNDVRIMDLGMVRLNNEAMALTSDGDFAGSLLYAAPELFRGEHAGPTSDLYGLGTMLYELATGEHPFAGRTPVDVITAHLSRAPPTLRSVVPAVSPFLCAYVSRLLAKNPADRPQSAKDVSDTLREGERSPWWRGRSAGDAPGECALPAVPVSRRTVLRGREGQMDVLRAAWARALAGRGGTVLLIGEPGIGKSRLVDALFHEIEGTDVHALYGAYVSDGGPGGLTSGLRRIVRAAGGPVAGLQRVLGDQAALALPLAAALGFGSATDTRPLLGGAALHGILARVVDGLARERPVLWVVEDVHDASPGSLRLLVTLARAAAERRVLLVISTRPEFGIGPFGALEGTALPTQIRIPRLTAGQIAEILVELSDDPELARRLAPAITQRSAGIPLFVAALWDELADRRRRGQEASVDALPLPSAIRDVLHARLRALDPTERELLEIGAVQGHEFDPELIARVRGERRLSVLRRLAEIEHRTRLIQPTGGAVRFDHREVRDVLLGEIDETTRRKLHTALADARIARDGTGGRESLSGEAAYFVARHHLRGDRLADAVPHATGALAYLRRAFRHEAAAELCRDLLGAVDLLDDVRATNVLLELAGHLSNLGRADEQRAALDQALLRAHATADPELQAAVLSRIGSLLVASGRPLEALGLLEEALEFLGDGAAARRGHLMVTLGAALHRLGRLEDARDRFGLALDIALETCDPELEGEAAGALGNVSADLGVPRTAERLQRRALRIAKERGDFEAECRAVGNLGITMVGLGSRDEALALFQRQRELALATGDVRVQGRCALNLARVHQVSGRIDAALSCFERACALYDEVGDRQGLGVVLGNLGQMHVMSGDVVAAREVLERALATFDEIGGERDRGYALVSLATLERHYGDPGLARDLYERSLACHEATRCVPGIAEAHLGLGVLCRDAGDTTSAHEHLSTSLNVSAERGLWDTAVLAALHLARDGGARDRALEMLALHGAALDLSGRVEASYIAWEISADARHLRAARAALDKLLAATPERNRPALEARDLHRRIRSAVEDPDRSPPPRERSHGS